MGTRSITRIYNQHGDEIVCMYRQFDGYLTVHGRELVKFVSARTIVNGYSLDATSKNTANGMGCLAAQIICHFKRGEDGFPTLGGIYLHEPGMGDVWEEYTYHVRFVEFGQPAAVTVNVGTGKEIPVEVALGAEHNLCCGDCR